MNDEIEIGQQLELPLEIIDVENHPQQYKLIIIRKKNNSYDAVLLIGQQSLRVQFETDDSSIKNVKEKASEKLRSLLDYLNRLLGRIQFNWKPVDPKYLN